MTKQQEIRTWIAYLADEDCGLLATAYLVAAGEAAVEPVIQAYLSPVNVTMTHNSQTVLVNLGSLAVAPLLRHLARNHMVFSMARVLGYIQDPRVIEPLIQLLGHKNPSVRWAATCSLREQKAAESVEPLIQRLRDRSSRIRWAAVEALAEFGDESALGPLKRLLTDRYPEMRARAANAIAQITTRASASDECLSIAA